MIPKSSGIYQIINTVNNNIYIGSALNLYRRRYEHFRNLKKNIHDNIILQQSYNKHGKKSFIFKVILLCDKENLILYEQKCLDKFNPRYNICKIAGSCLGRLASKETRKKMSIKRRQRVISDETRRKLSESGKGKIFSKERIRKMSEARKGFKFTKESRKKMSESHKGQLPSNTKFWGDIKSPNGKIYRNIFNLNAFCREHNLHRICIMRVLKGERIQHKGWVKV